MPARYLELVSPDADALVHLHERVAAATFEGPVAELGGARVARLGDGTVLAVRAPLAAHERPVIRVYHGTDDITRATAEATAAGGMIAWGPEQLGGWGRFAIVMMGGLELGLWQPA